MFYVFYNIIAINIISVSFTFYNFVQNTLSTYVTIKFTLIELFITILYTIL